MDIARITVEVLTEIFGTKCPLFLQGRSHGQEKIKGRTTFVSGRNYNYCADSLTFTSPKLVWNFCWNGLTTAVLLLLLDLTQNYRVTAIMKNYPISCFNFKP